MSYGDSHNNSYLIKFIKRCHCVNIRVIVINNHSFLQRVLRTNLAAPALVKIKVVGIARIQQGNAQVVNRDTRATNVN